jgi:hypothetical protein
VSLSHLGRKWACSKLLLNIFEAASTSDSEVNRCVTVRKFYFRTTICVPEVLNPLWGCLLQELRTSPVRLEHWRDDDWRGKRMQSEKSLHHRAQINCPRTEQGPRPLRLSYGMAYSKPNIMNWWDACSDIPGLWHCSVARQMDMNVSEEKCLVPWRRRQSSEMLVPTCMNRSKSW